MKRYKIVARIILLILPFINFALGAPALVRGIREVRVDVVDVAEDVTTASRKRWNPSDKWWMNAADRTITPSSQGSSDSDHRLEQELRLHDPRSPMDSNPSVQQSLGSGNSDNSDPLPVGPRPPAHNNLQLDEDINASPHSSPSVNSYLPVGPPSPAHNNLPLNLDLNASPQPSQEPADGSDLGSHSTGSSTDDYDLASSSTHSNHYHPTGSEPSSDTIISPWEWYEIWAISKSPSSSPSHDSNPPPRYGNLHVGSNRPLLSLGPTDDQPSPAPPSDPGPSTKSYPLLDPGSSKSDPGPSTRPYPASDQGPSTHPPPSPGPLQHESEDVLNELFRGRFKRRNPLPSRSRRPSNSPSHKHPDFELLQFND